MKITDLIMDDIGHIQQAAELLLNCFESCWNTLDEAIEEVKESLGDNRISRIAVNEQGSLIGWIAGFSNYHGNVWEMHPLVVNKCFQGQGIGRFLVEDFERRVAERGGITIILGSDDENNCTTIGGVDIYTNIYQRLQSVKNLKSHPFEFYQKVGYQIVGVIPDANGVGKPDILMAKRVTV